MNRHAWQVLRVGALATVLTLGAGCATTEEIDALRATAEEARRTAEAAEAAAARAESKADAAKRAAEDAKGCCRDNSEKIDRMFKKSMYK